MPPNHHSGGRRGSYSSQRAPRTESPLLFSRQRSWPFTHGRRATCGKDLASLLRTRRHGTAPTDSSAPIRAPRGRDAVADTDRGCGRAVGAVALTWNGTRRPGPDATSGQTRMERHKVGLANTGQHIRMQTHNPWVVGSSPTRPTEVGHPTTRLTWAFAPFSPLWSRPSDGLSGESGRGPE